MLETWLRESRVRHPALVILETWLREIGVRRLSNFPCSISDKFIRLSCHETWLRDSRVRLPTIVMLET